jgi:putative CocE/NonD family hydrolase
LQAKNLYCHRGGRLSFDAPTEDGATFDEFVSDPNRPVPYTDAIAIGMNGDYMTDDQRFASRRPDVLVYQTEALSEDLTVAGPLRADLWVATSGTDSDWVVKVIDVFPPGAKDYPQMPRGRHLGGYQMMVRSEAIRGRFRQSYEHPAPFTPNQPTQVSLELQDVLHTFAKGHRVMVHIQSSWFPLMDRNPQKYVANVFLADEKDFIKASQRIFCDRRHPTRVELGVWPRNGDSRP